MKPWDRVRVPSDGMALGAAAALIGAVGATSLVISAKDDPMADEGAPSKATASAPVRLQPVSTDDGVSVKFDTQLCAPKLLRTRASCAALSELKATGQALLADDALPKQPLTLVHPEDLEAKPRTVDGCDSYADLKRADWSGRSNADRRREAQFFRACGLLLLAERANPVPSAPALERPDLQDLDRKTLPNFNGQGFGANSAVKREGEAPPIWSLTSDAMLCRLIYLGTADFDGDGEPEHLMEWRLAARAGSFRDQGFGFMQRQGVNRVTFQVIDPFTS